MIVDFTGRLHPALVHLPIGILLLGVCFELLSSPRRLPAIRPAIPWIIFWGMLSAVLACISGLALNSGDDYEQELVAPHQWAGIALAILSILLYILYRRKVKNTIVKAFSLFTFVLIFVTGHLGGTVTHGEDFLNLSAEESEIPVQMKPIPDIQQAMLYTDVVQPLFRSKCYSCHGTRKQKGKLRLDSPELILKGGESGGAVKPGKAEESEMIERLLLPLDDDDHMPPKGKPQLTKEQVEILRWWVSTGADFHKKVGELKQPEPIKPVLMALQTGTSIPKHEVVIIPEAPVQPADTATIKALNESGVSVIPVARESNYLQASFINPTPAVDTLLTRLLKLDKQLVSLKLDGQQLGKDAIKTISSLTGLRKLQISNTALSDESLTILSKLRELRWLNLVGTSITVKGLMELKELKELRNIYVYKTGVTAAEKEALKKQFPNVTFDFGNYSLPMLEGDTSEIKF